MRNPKQRISTYYVHLSRISELYTPVHALYSKENTPNSGLTSAASRLPFGGLTGFRIRDVKTRGKDLSPMSSQLKHFPTTFTHEIPDFFCHPPAGRTTLPLSGYKRAPGRARRGMWSFLDPISEPIRKSSFQCPPHHCPNAHATRCQKKKGRMDKVVETGKTRIRKKRGYIDLYI